jgi:hypothetical protein
MWPIVIFLVISSYLLIYKVTKSAIGSFIGTLVYSFNTYFLNGQTGHLTLMAAFAFAPLALLFFMKILETRKMYFIALTAVFGFIVSFYEFRAFYMLAAVFFLFFLYFLLCQKNKSIKEILKTCLFALSPLILIGLLNSYWLLPLSKTGAITSNQFFSRGLFGNFLNIYEAFTLFHPFWTGSKPAIFEVQHIPFFSWLIPAFVIMSLILNQKRKDIIFFSLVLSIGILLTKQSGPPFESLYLWLYNHIPGFNAFREASKFFFLIALAYSVLIGGFIQWLWKSKQNIFLKYILTFGIAFVFLWNTNPILNGKIQTLFVPREIPSDYLKIEKFINNQNTFFRTLWLPKESRWGTYSNLHPRISTVDTIGSLWDPLTTYNQRGVGYAVEKEITDILQKPFSNNLLDISSIKYLIIPIKDTKNDDNFYVYYGNRDIFVKELKNLPYLHEKKLNLKELKLYENLDYKPHIYLTEEKETLYKNVEFKAVSGTFISPTQYKIKITNISKPLFINFSETYHPDWKLSIGNFKWF